MYYTINNINPHVPIINQAPRYKIMKGNPQGEAVEVTPWLTLNDCYSHWRELGVNDEGHPYDLDGEDTNS